MSNFSDSLMNISDGENVNNPQETAGDLLSYDPLFHAASLVFLISYLVPTTIFWTKISYHSGLTLGHLLLCGLVANLESQMIFWHCGFLLINLVQIICVLYLARENKFDPDIENIYNKLFLPFKISRREFSSLFSSNLAKVISLHPGECYAVQGLTRADNLGLLLHGKCSVLNEAAFLHNIDPGQFLDSPEFESRSDRSVFQVTICAAVSSKYIVWQRSNLEYLFVKQPNLGIVVAALVSRMMATNGKLPESFKDLLTAGSQNREVNNKVVTLTRDRSRRIVNRDEITVDVEANNGLSTNAPSSADNHAVTKL